MTQADVRALEHAGRTTMWSIEGYDGETHYGYVLRAITPAIVAATALVGAYATCAQFFRKGGVRAAMSNSHLDFFTTNKVAVLVEERGALAVYREAAFGKVTGLA